MAQFIGPPPSFLETSFLQNTQGNKRDSLRSQTASKAEKGDFVYTVETERVAARASLCPQSSPEKV